MPFKYDAMPCIRFRARSFKPCNGLWHWKIEWFFFLRSCYYYCCCCCCCYCIKLFMVVSVWVRVCVYLHIYIVQKRNCNTIFKSWNLRCSGFLFEIMISADFFFHFVVVLLLFLLLFFLIYLTDWLTGLYNKCHAASQDKTTENWFSTNGATMNMTKEYFFLVSFFS